MSLKATLAHLLKLEPMRRNGSEILVGHGSNESLLWALSGCGPMCKVGLIRHLCMAPLEQSLGVRVASRYFMANYAKNDVLLHLDDDKQPTERIVTALASQVASETGFPAYPEPAAPAMYGPSSEFRACGVHGINTLPYDPTAPDRQIVLTNLAATSLELNRRYLQAFPAYQPLLKASGGNGEDISFAHFVASHSFPGGFGYVGKCTQKNQRGASLMPLRKRYARGIQMGTVRQPAETKLSMGCELGLPARLATEHRRRLTTSELGFKGVTTGEYSRNSDLFAKTRFKAHRDSMCAVLFSSGGPYNPATFGRRLRDVRHQQGAAALANIGDQILADTAAFKIKLLKAFGDTSLGACACHRQKYYLDRFNISPLSTYQRQQGCVRLQPSDVELCERA